jgi:ADP-ribose pyrophosphatase YjhB (NUDIX family)
MTGITVRAVSRVELIAAGTALRPDPEHHAAIDAHWQAAAAANPKYFNGTIIVGAGVRHTPTALFANCHPMQFKDFLYWRHRGKPDWGFADLFGSAVIRARGGEILLGVAAATTMNAGSAYCVGGFIDLRDCNTDGTVDIAASIARELVEETGLNSATAERQSGTWVTVNGHVISVAQAFHSPAEAADLRTAILDFSHASTDRELADVIVVRSIADVSDARILPHAAALCAHLLQQT